MAKRHMLEDPFEYRGIREYAPYDEMKTINWKATARTGDLMVNIRNYTSLRAVRIFLNLADTGILKNEQLVELCISIAARFAGELLEQGIRVAVYANGKDVLTGDPMKMQPSAGPGHMESINRAFARISLEEGYIPSESFSGENWRKRVRIWLLCFCRWTEARNFRRISGRLHGWARTLPGCVRFFHGWKAMWRRKKRCILSDWMRRKC